MSVFGMASFFAISTVWASPWAPAWALSSAEEPAAVEAAPAETTAPAGSVPAVPDAAWAAVKGKRVIVDTADGEVEGELAAHDGDTLVLIADDGAVRTLPKSSATGVRVPRATATPAATPEPSAPEPKDEAASDDDAGAKDEANDDEKKDKKDKKKKRDHALLGAFTAHGAAYTHWRGDGVSAGGAAYAMDWGVGINPTPGFGMYAVAGGLLAAKIDHGMGGDVEGGKSRANYGHVAFAFAFGGKYYFSMIGAGVAFNRIALPGDTQKDIGLALPMKLFGRLPLPKNLYLGIGISYELGIVRDFNRFVNGIGGQIVFGRW